MKNDLRGQRVLILGLGQYPQGSGIAAAVFACESGAEVRVTDQKTREEIRENVERLEKNPGVTFRLGEHRLEDIEWADIVVRNPRVRPSSPEMRLAAKLGKRVESDISLFLARCPCPVVGITGTRGKSTTSTLVAEMLKATGTKKVWLGGNITISPLTFLSKIRKNDLVVLELSSWMLEVTGAAHISPRVAAVTNLMRDHLNTYEGMEEYAEAKAQIFRHQGPKDVVVLADDEWGRTWAAQAPGRVLRVGLGSSCDGILRRTRLDWRDPRTGKPGTIIERDRVRLVGEHNAMNLLTAALVARTAGASLAAIRQVASTFTGLADRLELLAEKNGVRYVNDTTATTPDALRAAVAALLPATKTLHVIAGGADKELEFDGLAAELAPLRSRICLSIFPGTAYEKLTKALAKKKVPYHDVESMDDAVAFHAAHAAEGDCVVLSPGCASFGLFKTEFERGAQFREAVGRIHG